MLRRKIYNELRVWKESLRQGYTKKALLVKGARQIGKTTAIRNFGKENYANFVEINFEEMPVARQAFNGNLDATTIVMNLSAMGFGPFVEGETLVFFDEVQSCPNARTAIKFLVEDGRFDYVESGSLLGINYRDVSSYPVGYEHQVEMYALDFEEFLWANGISDDVVNALRHCYETKSAVPDFIHQQINNLLRRYLIVGGMPEAVNTFLASSDFGQVASVQGDIMNSYRDDISKYADKQKALAKAVFDAIPSQLAKENKRFILADIEKGASMRKYGDATEWLVDAGIAYYSFNTTALELPFSFTEKRNMYKLFLHDTGLLCRQSLQNLQFAILNGDIAINEGALTENFVAAELAKHGHKLHYYDRKSRTELDFLIEAPEGIVIIEVKSGSNYKRHPSLNTALSAVSPNNKGVSRGIVLCDYNMETADSITYLPLYMTMFL